MQISQMKNIIVLKDLPSNLIDEAIVVLKKGNKIRHKETSNELNLDDDYDLVTKEAEFLINNCLEKIDISKNKTNIFKKISLNQKSIKTCIIISSIIIAISILVNMSLHF